jgi:hypothetical protein
MIATVMELLEYVIKGKLIPGLTDVLCHIMLDEPFQIIQHHKLPSLQESKTAFHLL